MQEELRKKDEIIDGVKQEYDKIINNYAQSIVNLSKGAIAPELLLRNSTNRDSIPIKEEEEEEDVGEGEGEDI